MAGQQYQRYIRVNIGGFNRTTSTDGTPGRIISAAGYTIDNLRITFDITLTADESAPEGTIEIYNLSRVNHQRIQDHGEDVRIEAGYLQGAGISHIWSGKVKRIIKTRVDHAFVTRITITDALSVRTKAHGTANMSEHDNSLPVRDIASKIVQEEMGLEISNISAIPQDATYSNFVASGDPRTALQTLLDGVRRPDGKRVGYIVDGEAVKLTTGADALPDGDIVVKTPTNGLIGVPEPEEDGRATFNMLLEPRLSLRGQFEIQGSDYMDDATFTITKIKHMGDNWTGRFVSTVECVDPDKLPEGTSIDDVIGVSGEDTAAIPDAPT